MACGSDLVAERAFDLTLEVMHLALAFLRAAFGSGVRIVRRLLGVTGDLVGDALGLEHILSRSAGRMSATDRRYSRTSSISASVVSALISASVTGRSSRRTG